jgi:hypothetical protein
MKRSLSHERLRRRHGHFGAEQTPRHDTPIRNNFPTPATAWTGTVRTPRPLAKLLTTRILSSHHATPDHLHPGAQQCSTIAMPVPESDDPPKRNFEE